MADMQGKWTGGSQFLFTDDGGRVVVTDPDGQGLKPPKLLLAALAGCAGVDVVRILEKKRKQITSIDVNVTQKNASDPPWTIEEIELEWVVRGTNLTEKAVHDAVRLAEEKYCSVAASLKSVLVTRIRVLNEDD
jgi:putative redox protein